MEVDYRTDGTLVVGTIRNGMRYRFAISGDLLDGERDPEAWHRLPSESSHRAPGPEGFAYEIRGSSVVRVDAAGAPSVFVPGRPWFLVSAFYGWKRAPSAVTGTLTLALGLALVHQVRSGGRPAGTSSRRSSP